MAHLCHPSKASKFEADYAKNIEGSYVIRCPSWARVRRKDRPLLDNILQYYCLNTLKDGIRGQNFFNSLFIPVVKITAVCKVTS